MNLDDSSFNSELVTFPGHFHKNAYFIIKIAAAKYITVCVPRDLHAYLREMLLLLFPLEPYGQNV